MFSFVLEEERVLFSLYSTSLDYFSPQTKTSLMQLGRCVICERHPSKDFGRCTCGWDLDDPVLAYDHKRERLPTGNFLGTYYFTPEQWETISDLLKRDRRRLYYRRKNARRRELSRQSGGFYTKSDIAAVS